MSASGEFQAATLTATQELFLSNNYGVIWNSSNALLVLGKAWTAVAMSGTGQYLLVAQQTCLPWVGGCTNKYFYKSGDYGVSFSENTYLASQFYTLSISHAGQYQAAGDYQDWGVSGSRTMYGIVLECNLLIPVL
jgi:hypothetical protein